MITKSFMFDLAENLEEIINCETPVLRGTIHATSSDNPMICDDEREAMIHAVHDRIREVEEKLKEVSGKIFKAGCALPMEECDAAALRAPGGPNDPRKAESH